MPLRQQQCSRITTASRAVLDAIVARTLGDDGTEVLPTVAEILGRPAATFAHWATTHADLFTGTDPH